MAMDDYLVRVVVCLTFAGTTRRFANHHRLHDTRARTFDISLASGEGDSPRWGLLKHQVNGDALNTVTLFAHPHSPSPWEEQFFHRESVDRLPVDGRYLAGVTAWSTPDQVPWQEQRLKEILREWLAFQSQFYRDAAGALTASPGEEKEATSTSADDAMPKPAARPRKSKKGSNTARQADVSGERLRRPL